MSSRGCRTPLSLFYLKCQNREPESSAALVCLVNSPLSFRIIEGESRDETFFAREGFRAAEKLRMRHLLLRLRRRIVLVATMSTEKRRLTALGKLNERLSFIATVVGVAPRHPQLASVKSMKHRNRR